MMGLRVDNNVGCWSLFFLAYFLSAVICVLVADLYLIVLYRESTTVAMGKIPIQCQEKKNNVTPHAQRSLLNHK